MPRSLRRSAAAAVVATLLMGATAAAAAGLGGVTARPLAAFRLLQAPTWSDTWVHDTFSGSNGQTLHTRTPDVTGGPWTVHQGTLRLETSIWWSGTRLANPNTAAAWATVDVRSADVDVSVDLSTTAFQRMGVVARASADGSTFLLARWNRGLFVNRIELVRVTGGTATVLASATFGTTVTSLRLVVVGTQVSVRVNGAATPTVSHTLSPADQALLGGNTRVGVHAEDAGDDHFDNFRAVRPL